MIRVLIVDDEKRTRDSIKKFMPWSSLGIQSVQTASNGLAALEEAKKLPPDIIICDVRMPKMDGIEFAKEMRRLYPTCRIVFISGFSDKEYLKSAILLKAVSYIEKPFNLRELEGVLAPTIESIREERAREADSKMLRDTVEVSLPLVREEIVLGLLARKFKMSDVTGRYAAAYNNFSDTGGSYTALCVFINWSSACDETVRRTLCPKLRQLIYTLKTPQTVHFLAGLPDQARVAVLIDTALSAEDGESAKIPENIRDLYLSVLPTGCSLSVGVGNAVTSGSLLNISYENAETAAQRQFYEGPGNVFYDSGDHFPAYSCGNNLADQFSKALAEGGARQLPILLNDFLLDLKAHRYMNIAAIKSTFIRLLRLTFDFMQRNGIETRSRLTNDSVADFVTETVTLACLGNLLSDELQHLLTRLEDKNEYSRKTNDVLKYIRQHYDDSSLSIGEIADSSYISVNYLCALFKKETGKTINRYITDFRIEKSKELLCDRSIRLYEVASRIGLADPDYFTRLFKKYEGCTPSEFREKS